ncbi:DNA/RNA non-specific endonuclease [Methylobacterium sp. A54F]
MRAVLFGLAVALAPPAPAQAATDACPALFAEGRAPALTNQKLAADTVPLCFEAFAVLHSGLTRGPLYAAEHLTRASVAAARRVDRVDAFHDEDRLPPTARSTLEDYARSGFDRGHLAPAGDMPSAEAQAQSFSLANIVPQNRALNRSLWAAIEESVRRLARERGELYVVTGVIFSGDRVEAIRDRVLVPTDLFKAVYDPARGEAAAYLAPNRAGGDWRAVSLQDLQTAAGIDVFPGLAPSARPLDLPEPREFSRDEAGKESGGREARREQGWGDWLVHTLLRALRQAVREAIRTIF